MLKISSKTYGPLLRSAPIGVHSKGITPTSSEAVSEMGGKPNKGTKKDKRLKENKSKKSKKK